MNGWFLTIIIFNVLSIGLNLGKHGEPKDTNYNFITQLISSAIEIFFIYMAIKKGF